MKKSIRYIVLILSLFQIPVGCLYGKGAFQLRLPLKLGLNVSVNGDNNIFRLSAYDREDFENNGRLALPDLHSLDDRFLKADIDIQYSFSLLQKSNRLWLRTSLHKYSNNGIKDYNLYSLYYRFYFGRRSYLEGHWFRMPSYYLRPYWDRDKGKDINGDLLYFHCDYSENRLRLKASVYTKPYHYYHLYTEYIQWYYNQRFTEFDTDVFKIGGRMYHTFSGGIKTGIAYSIYRADNVGRHGGIQRPDLSHIEQEAALSVNLTDLILLNKEFDIRIAYSLRYRFYTTEVPESEDILHAGHESMRQKIISEISVAVTKNISLSSYMMYDWRIVIAGSVIAERYKEFDHLRAGIGFKYTL